MALEIPMLSGSSASSFSPERLATVEKSLGIKFPIDYVDFLRTENGGVPERQSFFLGRNERVIERFLSIVEDYKSDPLGLYDIEVVWSQIEGRLNDSLVPVAALFSGDFLCFDFSESFEPSIVLWDHERSSEDDPAMTPVAPTFRDFADMLRE